MASKSIDKQKDKLLLDLSSQKEKIEKTLDSLKKSILIIQEGDGSSPLWNGEGAYQTISGLLSYIDKCYALLDYIHQCEKSIKKLH